MALDENPAKITEWIAPILEQANMDATAIGLTWKSYDFSRNVDFT